MGMTGTGQGGFFGGVAQGMNAVRGMNQQSELLKALGLLGKVADFGAPKPVDMTALPNGAGMYGDPMNPMMINLPPTSLRGRMTR